MVRRSRTVLPWLLSTTLLFITAMTALAATQLGPANAINKDRYWDSKSWENSAGDTKAKITLKCRDEDAGDDPNDWVNIRIWRHAGIFPPYSVGDQLFTSCLNKAKTRTWASNMGGPENFHFQIRAFSANNGYDGSHLIDLLDYQVDTTP